MKDSGITWVGKIPEHWFVMPNKYIMKKEKNLCPKYNGEDILSLTMNGVIVRDLDGGGKMPTSFDGYQIIYPNNLLMCLFDYDVTPRCIGLIKNQGLTSPAYSQFVMKGGNSERYFYYYYLMVDNTKELLHLAKNLRHSFTEEQFGMINAPVPPLDEQKKIANFLDEKCSEIDGLITDLNEEISTLEEYKQSVITELVCNGVNCHTTKKNSGVDWVKEIPSSWNIDRLKFKFDFGKGLSITKENLVENGVSVISYGQIHSKDNNGTSITDNLIRYVSEDYLRSSASSLVSKNDFIFADTSEDLTGCGNCVYVDCDYPLFAGYHTIIVHPKTEINTKYYAYLFKTDCWRSQIRQRVSGIKLFSITQKILKDTSIITPPIEEQLKIVEILDEKSNHIDTIISQKKEQISILEQYKKTIIYEYTTGKKEVV